MNAGELVTYVRNIHNAVGDDHWSDSEIFSLIEGKCNEALSILGLIESEDSTTLTVADQASYNFPDDAIRVKRLYCNDIPLKLISRRQYDIRNPNGNIGSGTPREFYVWNHKAVLVPAPSTAGQTVKFVYEARHPSITMSADEIVIPSIFHTALGDGVIFMMYAKDLNQSMATFFQNTWLNVHIPAMRKYVYDYRRDGAYSTVLDSDSALETEFGVI